MSCTIGIDIGTTSTIGVILDTKKNKIIYSFSKPVKLISKKTGWAEEDPNEWWNNTLEILNALGNFSNKKKIKINAIGVTGMLPALVLVDKKNKVLRLSIQQSDSRTELELKKIFNSNTKKKEFSIKTKCGVNQQLIAPKLLWLKKNEPKIYKRIFKILGSYDFINFKLTGNYSIEHNWALESGLMEFNSKKFTKELLALGKIKKSWMPEINNSEKIIGTLRSSIAKTTKLPSDLPVIAGCADHIISAFTAGISKPGDVLLKFGGAGDIMIASSKPFGDVRLFNDYHIIPGLFMPNGCMATSGSLLNWFVDVIGGNKISHKQLDSVIKKRSNLKTTCLVLPYFLGEKTPIHDIHAKGTIIGLSLNHNISDLWIGFLESICFAFLHHIEVLKENKINIKNVYASDGGTKSIVWMQIMSNILQKNLKVIKGHLGSSPGAAFLAAKANNLYKNYEEVKKLNKTFKIIKSNKKTFNYYHKKYQIFREVYEKLINTYPKFSKL